MNPFNPYQEIINLLQAAQVRYQLMRHEPVFTSEQAESLTGLELHQGAKSLLVQTNTSFVVVVVPGDRRVDMSKVAAAVGTDKARLASKSQVKQIMFCEVGACYPFGGIIGLTTLVDPALRQSDTIAFNPGVNDQTVVMATEDYLRIATPTLSSVAG